MTKKIARQVRRTDEETSELVSLPSRQKPSKKPNEVEKKVLGLSAACNVLVFLLIVLWMIADIQKDAICKNLVLESLRPDIATTCNQNPLQFVMAILARI